MPDLPPGIEFEVFAILDGSIAARGAAIASLCQRHAAHATAITDLVRDRERVEAGMRQLAPGSEGPTLPGPAAARDESARLDRREQVPPQIGRFRILSTIGTGGMGTVFLAERSDLKQRVALKVIKLGMDTRGVLARFEVERQALARMEHSNIAKILDAGATEQGQPWFAMEFVAGEPITRYCDEHRLSIDDRVRLFQQACDGVQHAHTKGIVHRDLTPNNVLVTAQEGKPLVKIIDFGLAKATQPLLTEQTVFTEQGMILGTPEYMAPEQAGIDALDIDTRADVYTLGVVLYELLVGALPFPRDELRRAGWDGLCRTIKEKEPPRPSTQITVARSDAAAVVGARQTDAAALRRRLRGDLDWIVLRCLEKDRGLRYQTVSALSDDLTRHLHHEPVAARAPSTAYLLTKLARRYRGQLVAAVLVLACLVAGLVVSLLFFLDSRRAHAETQRAKDALDPLVLRGLEQEAEADLWPVLPALAPRMRQWLARAEDLRGRVGVQRAYLAELEQQGRADGDRVVFDDATLAVRHAEQRKLASDLEQFFDPSPSTRNVAGVKSRLQLADTVRARTVEQHRARWDEARAAIRAADGERASALYRDLDLEPQVGLVPLGPDPVSKLWEFYHVDSGEPGTPLPSCDPTTGRIAMRAEYGFVFVLLPGGRFTMGSDKERDGSAEPDEMPRHEVTLAPLFLSKFECTQAQWNRLFEGQPPSHYPVGYEMPKGTPALTWTNPVESISCEEAETLCRRWAMQLPTEAQWEYVCRAGTDTIYAWSDDPGGLKTHDNVADAYAARFARGGWPNVEGWEDGHLVHAPVGTFAPSAFGMHDMNGNVTEMCRDLELPYGCPVQAGDGLRRAVDGVTVVASIRIGRGGSWQTGARLARCADRQDVLVRAPSDLVGFRPARAVQTDG